VIKISAQLSKSLCTFQDLLPEKCKLLDCKICPSVLTNNDSSSALINTKNKGGFIKPSADVIKICRVAEWVFRGQKYNTSGNIVNIVVTQAVKLLDFKNLFNDLNDHTLERDPVNNHAVQLVYLILPTFFTIRLHHENNKNNQVPNKIRHFYTKLIQFKHQ
jgi:hypothetical protein